MHKYEQLVGKYLKGNKKRTIFTMFGVAFGALLIFAVINITFCTIRQGILNAEQVYRFDAVFYGLSEEEKTEIENYPGVETVYGGALRTNNLGGITADLVLIDDWNHNPYVIQVEDGKYPVKSNEVLVDAELVEYGDYQIGDMVCLNLGTITRVEEENFLITGTFTYKGNYYDVSHYQYSYVGFLGLHKEDSEQLKDGNAVFVKYKNPYRIKALTKKIGEKLGTEYFINDSIAAYYNQTADGSEQAVNAAIILFLVVMISLMAIAVIKNTLRISVAERIRDYGVLRCAGASLKQLKKMLVRESMIIGGISGFTGIAVSYMVLVIFSSRSPYYDFTHFFILAAVLTMIVIGITMWLATIDPCKLIADLTPIEAVRNQMKSGKKTKYKVRKAGLVTKLFGVTGSYAYKNAMQNPKQFVTKVLSLTIGIVAFICTETICATYMQIALMDVELDKYYNVVVNPNWEGRNIMSSLEETREEFAANQRNMTQAISELRTLDEVGKTVGTYIRSVSDVDTLFVFYYLDAENIEDTDPADRYTEEFRNYIQNSTYWETYPEDETDLEAMDSYAIASLLTRADTVYAFDRDLLPKLSDALTEGTCDPDKLGEDGIILCNDYTEWRYNPDTDTDEPYNIEVYNYKVGDRITLITAPYDEFCRRLQEKENSFFTQHKGEIPESEWGPGEYEDEYHFLTYHFRGLIRFEVFRDLYEEGYYKTYTIKGIVSDNMLLPDFAVLGSHYILSKEQMRELFQGYEEVFYQETGLHVDGYNEDVLEILEKYGFTTSEYQEIMHDYEIAKEERDICDMILAVLLIFMTINIFNTSASSIVFRKGEFAFLRCVGMSKKKLSYMILLESIIALLFALFFGTVISCVCGYGIYRYMLAYLGTFQVSFVPLTRILGVSLLLLGIMMLAAWIPLQSIKKEIAPGLAGMDE